MRAVVKTHVSARASKFAQQPLVFVMRPNPEPEITAIVESRQRAKTRTRPHRPQVGLDFLEAEGFQAGLPLPEFEIFARDFLRWRREFFQTLPKFLQRGGFYGKRVALPAR
jgi:hypothetical protein